VVGGGLNTENSLQICTLWIKSYTNKT